MQLAPACVVAAGYPAVVGKPKKRTAGRKGAPPAWCPNVQAVGGGGYRSADLTHWVIERQPVPPGEPAFVNLFTVLVMYREPVAASSWRFDSKRPETIPGTAHKLVRGGARMPVTEAAELLSFNRDNSTFVVPAITAMLGTAMPVAARGTWLRPRVLGPDDAADRDLLPHVPGTLWLSELDAHEQDVAGLVDAKGQAWLVKQLREHLGVELQHQPDRLGTFLVAWPDQRLDIHATRSRTGRAVGARLLANGIDLAGVSLTVVGRRDSTVVGARTVTAPATWQVVDLDTEFDDFDLLAFGGDGSLLYAEHFRPLRTFEIRGMGVDLSIELQVQPRELGGAAVGEPRQIRIVSGIPMNATVSDVEPWEARRRQSRRAAAQAELVKQGRLRVYSGSPNERSEALDHLRRLVAAHHDGPLRLWDEYFGGNDLLELVGSLTHSQIPVRILTSERAPPASGVEARHATLDDVIRGLQDAAERAGTRFNIEHRSGPAFHDRFLITDRTCWQLGSSFNGIGKSFSTIVEFPDPDIVRAEFDRRWDANIRRQRRVGREL